MAGLLGDYIKINHGYAFDGDQITTEDNGIVLVMPRNIEKNGGFQEKNCKFYTGDYPDFYVLKPGDLIISMTDMSREGYILGCSASIPPSGQRTYLLNQGISRIDVVRDDVDKRYLYWFMRSPYYHKSIVASSTGSVIRHTKPSLINRIEVSFPSLEEQKKAASILDSIENKIRINHRIIHNLEENVLAVYKKKFVHTDNSCRKKCSIGDVFQVFIGRTPPRTESQWLSSDSTDTPWVLITDMREEEPFIHDSATHLTSEALKRFYELAEPLFQQIKIIQRENVRLQKCRETLLPKIMEGAVDVSRITI